MKTEKNILTAFILNLFFSIFEIVGGIITGSVAIMSDAIHDFGDAISIGISFFLEKKSNKEPNKIYTYGYQRYSVLGALITTLILTIGEVIVIYNALERLFNPVKINYNGMILFSIVGIIINGIAAFKTSEGNSINQKAVNLHMLEDVLGWIIVFIGAILMKFTDITIIDSIMSIGVAIFILVHAFKNYKRILDLFLVKTPNNIEINELEKKVEEIEGVKEVHHVHIWSLNGEDNYATMHIKTNVKDSTRLKKEVRDKLKIYNIIHVTIEIEDVNYKCEEENCHVNKHNHLHNHHNH